MSVIDIIFKHDAIRFLNILIFKQHYAKVHLKVIVKVIYNRTD